jgi:hypothetical protein
MIAISEKDSFFREHLSDCDYTEEETEYTANTVKECLSKAINRKTGELVKGRVSAMQTRDLYFTNCDSPVKRNSYCKSKQKTEYFNTPTLKQTRISHASFISATKSHGGFSDDIQSALETFE